MITVYAAFTQATRDLMRPGMLWHVLWPPIVALIAWVLAGYAFWQYGMQFVGYLLPILPWSGWEWVSQWAGVFLLLAMLAMLTYLTTILLVAVVALPMIVNTVALRDYPDLVRHGENVFWRSLRNTVVAGGIFLIGGLLSLPLLVIPGVILVLPLLWAMWLNQRTFRFDALAEHATDAELQQLIRTQRPSFYLAGVAGGAVAYVPLIQFVAPVLTALIFVHLGLTALRRQRQTQGIQL